MDYCEICCNEFDSEDLTEIDGLLICDECQDAEREVEGFHEIDFDLEDEEDF